MTVRLWGQDKIIGSGAGDQGSPSVTTLTNGDLVVVWEDNVDGLSCIMAQLFASSGQALGAAFSAIPLANVDMTNPVATALADGGFSIAFEFDDLNATPTVGRQAYNADGTIGFASQYYPGTGNSTVAALGSGKGAVQAYEQGGDIVVQMYDSSGVASTFLTANTTTAGLQSTPDVAVLTTGAFVVVWSDQQNQVRGALFAANGSSLGADFGVNPVGFNDGQAPKVTALEGGGFVVSWNEYSLNVGNFYDVRGQMYDAGGVAQGSAFTLNSRITGIQSYGDVVGLPDGGFIAVWFDAPTSTIRGQQFDVDGHRVDGEFLAASVSGTISGERGISATLMADGRVALTFDSLGENGLDVHLQILDPRDGLLEGTAATDFLYGGAYDDQILALDGDDYVLAGAGADQVLGGTGHDNLYGEAGDDTLYGDVGSDFLSGGDGDDVLLSGTGQDVLQGGAGSDYIAGGEGLDTVFFSEQTIGFALALNDNGEASVTIGGDTDTLYEIESISGGQGGDTLSGNFTANTLSGFHGDDVLKGGGGNDILDGHLGVDTADYRDKALAVVVTLNANIQVQMQVGGVNEDKLNGIENLIGGSAADVLTGDHLDNRLDGFTGNDVLKGGVGLDTLIGGVGSDLADYRDKATAVVVTLNGAVNANVTVGGVQEDILNGVEHLYGGSAADTLTGDAIANVFRGGGGADVLDGKAGVDSVDFRDKATAVVLTLAGAVVATATVGGLAEDKLSNIENVYGGQAGDTLLGDGGANLLSGEGGADKLRGGGGADSLYGGLLADAFVFGSLAESAVAVAGRDTIKDFSHVQADKIDLSLIDAITGGAGDAFTLGAFAVGSAGRLLVTADGAGKWLVQGDVNGDAVADFAISVMSSTALVASDFVL